MISEGSCGSLKTRAMMVKIYQNRKLSLKKNITDPKLLNRSVLKK